jgi:hypothetical protein
MIPRVFMLSPHKNVDVGPATRLGELTYLFGEREARPTFWDPALIEEALERLETAGFDPEHDVFLVAGHMAPVVRLACSMVHYWPDAQGLFWDSIQRCYVRQSLSVTSPKAHTGYRS